MNAQATIYGVISTLEKYPIEEAKAMLFRMAQDLEVTVTQRAKLEPSSRLDMLTEAHALCRIKGVEDDKYQCRVEYLVTGRATVRTKGDRQKYVYEGDTFDLVAVMKTYGEGETQRIKEIFPPGTRSFVISLRGTPWEEKMGYPLTDIDERDLEIHELSEPIRARDRFSAPPAIDVENIMEVVRQWVAGQLGMTPENEHWKDEEWQAAVPDLRSRLLSLLSPGKGDGVTVAENKAPRS